MSEYHWPHFENIHRVISTSDEPDLIFEKTVCITEKMDGSNLTIHIKKDKQTLNAIYNKKNKRTWHVEELIGRNSVIWNMSSDVPITSLSYGSAGKLEKLPTAMLEYTIDIAQRLKVDEIYITGEVYRLKNQKFVSWHPFGYKVCGSDKDCDSKICFLTSTSHKLLKEAQIIPEIKTHEEMIEKLQSATNHQIFPPPILFVGKMEDGINSLFDMMKLQERNFEGCFIIWEDNTWGFKWKTGLFEEQKRITSVSDIKFLNSSSIRCYTKLMEIFDLRPKYDGRESILRSEDAKRAEEESKCRLETLKRDLSTACNREITKMESFTHIPKAQRKSVVEKMIQPVINEAKELYTESGLEFSWSEEVLKETAKSIITPIVMKIPFEV